MKFLSSGDFDGVCSLRHVAKTEPSSSVGPAVCLPETWPSCHRRECRCETIEPDTLEAIADCRQAAGTNRLLPQFGRDERCRAGPAGTSYRLLQCCGYESEDAVEMFLERDMESKERADRRRHLWLWEQPPSDLETSRLPESPVERFGSNDKSSGSLDKCPFIHYTTPLNFIVTSCTPNVNLLCTVEQYIMCIKITISFGPAPLCSLAPYSIYHQYVENTI